MLDSVWGQARAVTDRTVDVYVLRLRHKVEVDPANPLLIRSVRGFGEKRRFTMEEVAVYKVADGKIVYEEFFYNT